MSKNSDLAYGTLLLFVLLIYFISEYFISLLIIVTLLSLIYFLSRNFYLKNNTKRISENSKKINSTAENIKNKSQKVISYSGTDQYINSRNYLKMKVSNSGKLDGDIELERKMLKSKKFMRQFSKIKILNGTLMLEDAIFLPDNLKKINGNLTVNFYFDNKPKKQLIDLDLNKLEEVVGDLLIKGNVNSFGQLKIIGNNLNVRNAIYDNLGLIKEIGNNLSIYKNDFDKIINKPLVKGKVIPFKRRQNRILHQQLFPENFPNQKEIDNIYKLIKRKSFTKAYKFYIKINRQDFFLASPIIDLLFFQIKTKKFCFTAKKIIQIVGQQNLTEFAKNNPKGIFEELIKIIENEDFSNFFNLIDNEIVEVIFKSQFNYGYVNNINSLNDYTVQQESDILRRVILKLNDLMRKAENNFRKSQGLKNVGESWVSEIELFNKLKNIFKDFEIQLHASPEWLGRQHLDIYFVDFNIAVEYQGRQHFEPIEFFGGEEAFKKNIERDKRKRELCKKNSCHLIEVKKGYDIDDLKKQIEESINK